ncbi:MAG: TrbC/VirB2 family protein [Candidatus Eremiobacteraeota bacterium]|nr:TrbC/VirB2 family protein [Candidatus Eremiobacteraeota bacterium]
MMNSKKTFRLAGAMVPTLVLVAMTAPSATTVITAPGGAGGTASALPWEGVLANLANALTGNTAKVICIIAIFVAGVALIFGEDLGHFARRLLMITIAAAFLIGAGSFVSTFIGGAHI